MSWKCKEHIVAKLSHQQRQKKKSNFLLQKFKSATCRTNLEVPQTGKEKKKRPSIGTWPSMSLLGSDFCFFPFQT